MKGEEDIKPSTKIKVDPKSSNLQIGSQNQSSLSSFRASTHQELSSLSHPKKRVCFAIDDVLQRQSRSPPRQSLRLRDERTRDRSLDHLPQHKRNNLIPFPSCKVSEQHRDARREYKCRVSVSPGERRNRCSSFEPYLPRQPVSPPVADLPAKPDLPLKPRDIVTPHQGDFYKPRGGLAFAPGDTPRSRGVPESDRWRPSRRDSSRDTCQRSLLRDATPSLMSSSLLPHPQRNKSRDNPYQNRNTLGENGKRIEIAGHKQPHVRQYARV